MIYPWFFLRRLFLQICIVASVALIGCDDKNIQREDIGAFLTSYDPALKSKRDELVNALEATQQKMAKLQELLSTYKSERAKGFVTKRLEVFEGQELKLSKLLEQIDAEVEVAMASKAVDSADGGGLQTVETSRILTQADKLLSQSNQLAADADAGFEYQASETIGEIANESHEDAGIIENSTSGDEGRSAPGFLGIEMDNHYMSIMIQSVYPASPADEAGLIAGDSIETIYFKDGSEWGEPVSANIDVSEFKEEISQRKKGDQIKLEIRRIGWSESLMYVIELGAFAAPLKFDQGPQARAKKLASVMGRSSVHMALRTFPLYQSAEDGDLSPIVVKNVHRGDFMVAPWDDKGFPVKNSFGRLIYTALCVYFASGETGYLRIFENETPMLETVK